MLVMHDGFDLDVEWVPGAVHVWFLDCDAPDLDSAWAASCLSEAERARSARLPGAILPQRFAVGRACVRTILGRLLGIEASAVKFVHGAHGKPTLALHRSIRFSVADDEALLMLGICHDAPIGVDVQSTPPRFPMLDVARARFRPEEAEAIAAAAPADRPDIFLRHWTCKEAIVKAVGSTLGRGIRSIGLQFEHSHVRIVQASPEIEAAGPWELAFCRPPEPWSNAMASVAVGRSVAALD